MTDHRQPVATALDAHPGASLVRMLVIGLVLIVFGMVAALIIV